MKQRAARTLLLFVIMIAISALVAACGDDDATAPEDDGPFTGTIRVLDDRFSPASVTISLGDSVTWRWEGGSNHTVTHGTSEAAPPDVDKFFDSPLQDSGTFGYRFSDPLTVGTVAYFCRLHLAMGMTGTITVEP